MICTQNKISEKTINKNKKFYVHVFVQTNLIYKQKWMI